MFAKLAVLATLASSTLATVFMTDPTASTVCTGNAECTVTWIDSGEGSSLQDFGDAVIGLYVGSTNQQSEMQRIVDSVNVATTSTVSFTVNPSIGEDADVYFIRVTSLKSDDEVFSSMFQLTGMTGTFNETIKAQIADERAETSSRAAATSSGSSNGTSATVSKTSSGTSARQTGSTSGTSSSSAASTTVTGNNSGAGRVEVASGVAGFMGVAAILLTLL